MRFDPAKVPLTHARLREVLHYDQETGLFTWIKPRRGILVRSIAGHIDDAGYRRIIIDGHGYYAHLLAWFYVYGEWPPRELDHKSLNKDENWIENLRLASRSLNMANSGNRADSLTGIKGVHRRKKDGRYRARIMKDGRHIHLGYFDDPVLAHNAYVEAAQRLFGDFARGE